LCTDWDVLQETQGNNMDSDIDRKVTCTTDYISWCRDMIVPARSVCCFPNNKPWITSDIKALLNQKNVAFRDGDREKQASAA